ncbi:hypothetical protein [Aquamicrobium defluvii]|uniref:Helix-turn-helix protein n=1 Tax=Aquamicrobium defluvii TaxID=69279 RepID=A0A011TAS5_9HYPH|nr:hypothetical protein [Aquamicrobium defluvii]EXL08739.1 hypothetical protein BG36_03590 [Aquamicrobium defluvii]EZQ14894.1 hypothetical protein CF98_14810 [Halopseudomonas bauzanensis]
MSSAAIKWSRSQNFGSAALKAVVNAIAVRVDRQGATWAAQQTLAQDLGMSDRNLRSHLKTLQVLGVITRTVRSRGRQGRASDLIILSLHRKFDLSAKDLRAVRQRLAEESSNRKKSTLPTGRRLPGNSKRTTYHTIQGGNLSGLGTALHDRPRPALAVVNGSIFPDGGEDEL